ncbi:MAG: DUF998 domain-containing protein [Thermomicrobia bacterium]|nr:DUF998 domain-containing protein [Thermomicrobia bacterium]
MRAQLWDTSHLTSRSLAVATSISIADPAFFLLANAALHLLRRDLSPATHYISEYAVGRFGLLMSSALVILGIGTVALALVIRATMAEAWLVRIGTAVLFLSGLGTILTGLFRTDIDGQPSTIAGAIHGRAAFIAILFEAISVLILTAAFFRDSRWRWYRPVSLVFSLVVVISGALLPVLPRGTGERLLVYTLVLWLFATALRMRTVNVLAERR